MMDLPINRQIKEILLLQDHDKGENLKFIHMPVGNRKVLFLQKEDSQSEDPIFT